MKKIIICLLLVGCAPAPVKTTTETAKKSIVALEKNLPAQCRTETINAQIDAIKSQIDAIPEICAAQYESLRQERNTWRVATIGLVGIILTWFFAKKTI